MLFASGGPQTSLRLTDASSSKIWNYFTEKQKQWNQQEDKKTAALLQGRIEFLLVSSIQEPKTERSHHCTFKISQFNPRIQSCRKLPYSQKKSSILFPECNKIL